MQRNRERGALGEAVHFGRRCIDDRLEVVQTLFVTDVSGPVDRVTSVLTIAAQVVNLGANEGLARRVVKKEKTELARFVARVEHHRRAVYRHVNTAGTIDNLVIDRDTGPGLELVPDPEPAIRRIRFTSDDRAVDLCLQIGAVNRDKTLGLPQCDNA